MPEHRQEAREKGSEESHAGQATQPSIPLTLPGAQRAPRTGGSWVSIPQPRPGVHLGPQKHLEKKAIRGQVAGRWACRMKEGGVRAGLMDSDAPANKPRDGSAGSS